MFENVCRILCFSPRNRRNMLILNIFSLWIVNLFLCLLLLAVTKMEISFLCPSKLSCSWLLIIVLRPDAYCWQYLNWLHSGNNFFFELRSQFLDFLLHPSVISFLLICFWLWYCRQQIWHIFDWLWQSVNLEVLVFAVLFLFFIYSQ